MTFFSDLYLATGGKLPLLRTLIFVIILIVFLSLVIGLIRRKLLKRASTKRQVSNIQIFSNILRYISIVLVIFFAFASYVGSWGDISLIVGFISAALGWALQRPITGVAGWIMVVLRRPFEIGDMIVMAGVRGIVFDLTLTHIYLYEIGGIGSSEEKSGRIILIPNSILFEQNIINYTQHDENTLDEVVFTVTFRSNLKRTIEIAETAAQQVLQEIGIKDAKPYVRTFFQQSGINMHIRFFTPATRRQEVCSNITHKIFDKIAKAKDIQFAFPHTHVVIGKEDESKKMN